MKIFQVNAVPYGSTGKIMFSISDMVQKSGGKCICATGFSWHKKQRDDCIVASGFLSKSLHMILSRITGFDGFFSFFSTLCLIHRIGRYDPDIIHLHNIHGWYLNFPLFFRYIRKKCIPVVWTLHDCWTFTGHCPHYSMMRCDKWMTECSHCMQYKSYPQSLFDNSHLMYRKKKKWFTDIPCLMIVTPSEWLKNQVEKSFLKDYPIKVINNGIDLTVFKPTQSTFREKYNISQTSKIVLGVSLGWDNKKGLDVFIELSKRLGDKYQIVLVGTDGKTDALLTSNVISIHRTQNQQELAEIYTAADVFVNPTREDNFPTVNIESIACGTPVVTFKTGGSPEMLDETCGSIVECDDIDSLEREIIRICEDKPYSEDLCLKRAAMFDENTKFKEYISLYRSMQ